MLLDSRSPAARSARAVFARLFSDLLTLHPARSFVRADLVTAARLRLVEAHRRERHLYLPSRLP